jgi:hypothetical protein|tara:strand:- start:3126 stop:3242 length:117 start_codon:yes stop_codon:yes gene_type:complete
VLVAEEEEANMVKIPLAEEEEVEHLLIKYLMLTLFPIL